MNDSTDCEDSIHPEKRMSLTNSSDTSSVTSPSVASRRAPIYDENLISQKDLKERQFREKQLIDKKKQREEAKIRDNTRRQKVIENREKILAQRRNEFLDKFNRTDQRRNAVFDERKKKVEEFSKREEAKRQAVLERKKRLMDEEFQRKTERILRRELASQKALEGKRHGQKMSSVFASTVKRSYSIVPLTKRNVDSERSSLNSSTSTDKGTRAKNRTRSTVCLRTTSTPIESQNGTPHKSFPTPKIHSRSISSVRHESVKHSPRSRSSPPAKNSGKGRRTVTNVPSQDKFINKLTTAKTASTKELQNSLEATKGKQSITKVKAIASTPVPSEKPKIDITPVTTDTADKEAYRQKLAEKRREAREKAEREELERKRLEEEAEKERELERQRKAELQQKLIEEENRRKAEAEQNAIRIKEEREAKRLEEERRLAEEKEKIKIAAEQKLKRFEIEQQERINKEEAERAARKARLDSIMKRTRTPGQSPAVNIVPSTKAEIDSKVEVESSENIDDDHERTSSDNKRAAEHSPLSSSVDKRESEVHLDENVVDHFEAVRKSGDHDSETEAIVVEQPNDLDQIIDASKETSHPADHDRNVMLAFHDKEESEHNS